MAGHKGSTPVRIGNGAVDHLQLVSSHGVIRVWQKADMLLAPQDIYGELMDAIYLAQKFSKPLVRIKDLAYSDRLSSADYGGARCL